MNDASVAWAGHHAARRRVELYAACDGALVRRGMGWVAVATGVVSNDMNGVVSRGGAAIPDDVVDDLIDWFAELAVPASWLTTAPDQRLATMLVERGSRPERTGWWAGRQLDGPFPVTELAADVVIDRVQSRADLSDWLDIAAVCGWSSDADDRSARQRLYGAVGLDHPHLAHWVARRDRTPVGMASSFVDGDVIDLCNLAVIESHRRIGIGRALVAHRIRDARQHHVRVAVSALSPDGWQLYQTLGFVSVPVVPDTWFYLPTPPA